MAKRSVISKVPTGNNVECRQLSPLVYVCHCLRFPVDPGMETVRTNAKMYPPCPEPLVVR